MNLDKVAQKTILHPNWKKVSDIAYTSKYDDSLCSCSEEVRAETISQLLNLELLSCGGHRLVVKIDGHAVKIPLEAVGFDENINECQFWSKLPHQAKKHFIPCCGGDIGNGSYSVFPIAELIDYKSFILMKDKVDEIRTFLNSLGVVLDDCDADRYDQWGFYNGNLVVIDYGSCHYGEA